MEKKFIQREETRYSNNEFANMPSIDYGTWCSDRLCAKNKNRIDMDKAKEICAKYGFGCTYINSTFGGDDADFLIYFKVNIDADEYERLREKAYRDNDRESQEKCWELRKQYTNTYVNMHKCMHELDEQTNLVFNCCWAGNCGIFGSDDVRRISYGGGNHLMDWKTVLGCWDSCIFDTRHQLSKGVYIIANTKYIKPEKENSPELDDTMEENLLGMVKKYLNSGYTAGFEVGKRQVDNDSYKALVVRYKDGEYCCMIRFSRDWMGRYKIWRARPLCGESSWVMDWKNPKDDIVDALGDCSIYAE